MVDCFPGPIRFGGPAAKNGFGPRVAAAAVLLSLAGHAGAEPGWWMTEPVRLIQTNIPIQQWRDLEPAEQVRDIREAGGNTWLFNVGGIYANYPTELPFQAKNPYLENRGDLMGEIYDLAKQQGVRLLARFDFSRFDESIAEKYPEWCFRRKNGESITYNGLVTSCVNSGYYREAAPRMVEEFLRRYPAGGVFVNWWANHQTNGYSGLQNGVCHCEGCRERWPAFAGDEPLPNRWNADYRKFIQQSSLDSAKLVRAAIKRAAPDAALILYGTKRTEVTDGFTQESKTNYDPDIWWPYQSSLLVNSSRSSVPDQMVFNVVVNFIQMPYRFEPNRLAVNQNRMLQGMAHGGFPALYTVGPIRAASNKQAAAAVEFPFAWHKEHERLVTNQTSAAAIALINEGMLVDDLRGVIRLLSEHHLPFRVYERANQLPPGEPWDLIVSAPIRNARLRQESERNNHLIIGPRPPVQFDGAIGKTWTEAETRSGYWKVSDSQVLPRVDKHAELIGIEGEYLEPTGLGSYRAALHLVPPAIHSTTEITHIDRRDTTKPGLLFREAGSGVKTVWMPWSPTTIYQRRGGDSIRLMFEDTFEYLLAGRPQIRTDAHPLVEMSYMQQPSDGRRLVHLLNLTNQLHGSGGKLLPMRDISLAVRGEFASAYSADQNTPLPITVTDGYTRVTAPELRQYDIIVFE